MWVHKGTYDVGGLHETGFALNKDFVIALSSNGRGLFDCQRGEKIARQYDEFDWLEEINQSTCSIKGFDQLQSDEFVLHGLSTNDRLPKTTADGWRLVISAPEKEKAPLQWFTIRKIYLESPDQQTKQLVGKDDVCEMRAYGFSDTGNSFIIASSCELVIYSRT